MLFLGQGNHLATLYTPLIELWWVGEFLHVASAQVHASPNQSQSHYFIPSVIQAISLESFDKLIFSLNFNPTIACNCSAFQVFFWLYTSWFSLHVPYCNFNCWQQNDEKVLFSSYSVLKALRKLEKGGIYLNKPMLLDLKYHVSWN